MGSRYDGLAGEYDAFLDTHSSYYRAAAEALRRHLGPGPGRCLDLGCGQGHFALEAVALGWTVAGVDDSADQLARAAARAPELELHRADAAALPFPDATFDAGYSTFTHTDLDDFAGALREARRVLRPGARFVYVGNHPCFVGATQEHVATGNPRLHDGYRAAGRRDAASAPGATPGGWRARVGSFVHVPLGDFLSAFAGFTIVTVEELDDGFEYPKTIAVAVTRP